MLVSHKWLNTFFDGSLPSASEVERALTFHAWEIEGVEEKDGDQIIEVNVLPDTASWALSHRGVAKNLSVILDTALSRDPLKDAPSFDVPEGNITIDIESDRCRRFTAARIEGVKVGPSPDWLRERIEAIGQKSINNIVDAANYVMFDMGQPIHAFDADKLGGGESDHLVARLAKDGEKITTLTGEEYELTKEDLLIVDGANDTPVGIAGIKGGKVAEVDESTKNLLIECANFDPVAVRKTSGRLKLRTDASQRYENGVVVDLPPYGQKDVIEQIIAVAGGKLVAFVDAYPNEREVAQVNVELTEINSLLGVTLTIEDVAGILDRFGYEHSIVGEKITIVPPFERPDLVIAEDVIEEIGRIYGYEHVVSVTPEPLGDIEINKRFYYSEKVRNALVSLGFSEIFTSSFRNKDTVVLENALASDKGCLRSELRENMGEALKRNRMNADLLGLEQIQVFEIGTVFQNSELEKGEHTSLAFGVWSPGGYKPKRDDRVLEEAVAVVVDVLQVDASKSKAKDGIVEVDLDAALENLPDPDAYIPFEKGDDATYQPFSPYPFVTRDIALWTEEVTAKEVEELIVGEAGELLTRITLFDTFEKDGKTSYAFRLVFQSYEKTLTDDEVNRVMDSITSTAGGRGWVAR